MPLELSLPIVRWLKELSLIQGEVITNERCEISYNDQLYFQNGYLIGQLLKSILKSKGYASEALMRIRKIAHISSNQNWGIIKEIMQEINFQEPINPHNINLDLVQSIIEYLFDHFCPKLENKMNKKEKRTYIDPGTFSNNKQLQQSYNLLEFFLLALTKIFNISVQEGLGLLVSNCKYFKKVIVQGTNNKGYMPIISFYKLVVQHMPLVNQLISEQLSSQTSFMNCLGLAVLSQNQQVCDIGCIIIENLESNRWLEQQGYALLLRSPNDKVLDLLLRKIHPNFSLIFNKQIELKFPNHYVELLNYAKLLEYLHKSIYCREILQLLSINHYLQKAFDKFEPDTVKQQPKKIKLAAKNLIKVIVTYFWGKLGYQQKNRICLCFEPQFCQSQQERLTTLCYLFQMITELSMRQAEFVKKFYRIINKYYSKGTFDLRAFILSNLSFLYQNHPDHFPVGFFLETYQIALPVQTNDYQLLELISRNPDLLPEEILMLLKICTIYYYQQLQAACFIIPINNLLRKFTPVEWASQLMQEILTKWPSLPIPPFQMLPPNTNKIKFRSIGLKKKEMLQFTELNRYKSILKLLAQINSRQFLINFGKFLGVTINKVEKSKIKEMQNTKVFLNNLLARIDVRKLQIKQQRTKQILRPRSQAIASSQLSDKLDTDPFLQEYDHRENMELETPIRALQQQNEFMRSPHPVTQFQDNPLLPFSDELLQDLSQRNYSEDSLFQNYEIIYIKNTASKYANLLKFVSQTYERSANIHHFLLNLNILNYFQKDLTILESSQNRLKLLYEDIPTIAFKLTVQMALVLFQFKKSRRITVKCLESFYELLVDKNHERIENKSPEINNKDEKINLNAKMDFRYQITKKNIQNNKKAESHMICFEVVSEMLKKAIGVYAIEPMSCIISQILPFSQKQSPSKLIKQFQKSRVAQFQQKQLEQLQKIIENESRLQVFNNRSTPLKSNKKTPPMIPKQKQRQSKINGSQKWADIQKKVIMRRRQLEGKQKAINEA